MTETMETYRMVDGVRRYVTFDVTRHGWHQPDMIDLARHGETSSCIGAELRHAFSGHRLAAVLEPEARLHRLSPASTWSARDEEDWREDVRAVFRALAYITHPAEQVIVWDPDRDQAEDEDLDIPYLDPDGTGNILSDALRLDIRADMTDDDLDRLVVEWDRDVYEHTGYHLDRTTAERVAGEYRNMLRGGAKLKDIPSEE